MVATLVAGVAVFDAEPRQNWPELQRQHEEYQQLAAAVNQQVPGDSTLAAGHGWHLSVYLDRPVFSLRMVMGKGKGLERALEDRSPAERRDAAAWIRWQR